MPDNVCIPFGSRNVLAAKNLYPLPSSDGAPQDNTPSKKIVKVLLGNLTSFSPKMESYLFKPKVAKNVELFGLIEVHKNISELDNLKSKFKRYGRDVVLNGAQLTGRSEEGTHGGELASAKSDIDFVKFKEML